MERHEILDMMGELKLAGMRLAFDEVIANGLKRQHPVPQIIGELLKAEIAEKHARSIPVSSPSGSTKVARHFSQAAATTP